MATDNESNHGRDHESTARLRGSALDAQVIGAEEIFLRVLGVRPWLFRPPGGVRSDATDAYLSERGYTQVMWTLHTGDYETRDEDEAKVKGANGTVSGSVTKNLHYLVIGDEGSPLYGQGKKGSKQVKAEQLNAAGANIRIISETLFLQMLAGQQRQVSDDATLAGCRRLWEFAIAPGPADAPVGKFARQYIRKHHPILGAYL